MLGGTVVGIVVGRKEASCCEEEDRVVSPCGGDETHVAAASRVSPMPPAATVALFCVWAKKGSFSCTVVVAWSIGGRMDGILVPLWLHGV